MEQMDKYFMPQVQV